MPYLNRKAPFAWEDEFERGQERGTLYRLQSRNGGAITAVFVPTAAAGRNEVSILVWIHGLTLCGGEGRNAFDYVRSREFPFTRILSDSGRPIVLAVPSMNWTRGQASHPLGRPAQMNAFIEEVRSSLWQAGWSSPPSIDTVILAGHSKAYAVLDGLAASAARPDGEWSRGALAKLSDVWAVDSTYGYRSGACQKWVGWAHARSRTRFRVLYRQRSATAAAAVCVRASATKAGITNITFEEFSPTAMSHCEMPRRQLPHLLGGVGASSARPAAREPEEAFESDETARACHGECEHALESDSEWEWEAESGQGALAGLAPSELKAVRITNTFETGRAGGFGGLTGNFDGQGLSFGLMNWTVKAGSLVPLLQEFITQHADRYARIFGADAERFKQMVFATRRDAQGRPVRDVNAQMAFVRGTMNDANQRHIVEPWKTYFHGLEHDPAFRRIQVKAVKRALGRAREWFTKLGFQTERGFVFLFDLVSSHGPFWLNAPKFRGRREKLLAEGVARKKAAAGRGLTDREAMEVIANMIAAESLERFRHQVRIRKLWFVQGAGKVHGQHFDIERDFGVTDGPPNFGAAPGALGSRSRALGLAQELESPAFGRSAGRIPMADRIDPGVQRLVRVNQYGEPPVRGQRVFHLHPRALAAFKALRADALAAGFGRNLFSLTSAWRSQATQNALAVRAQRKYGAAAGTWVAQSRSEHITGRAFDLALGIENSSHNALTGAFDKRPAYRWLKQNAARYGLNPYTREPWHWSYNVVPAAGAAA